MVCIQLKDFYCDEKITFIRFQTLQILLVTNLMGFHLFLLGFKFQIFVIIIIYIYYKNKCSNLLKKNTYCKICRTFVVPFVNDRSGKGKMPLFTAMC